MLDCFEYVDIDTTLEEQISWQRPASCLNLSYTRLNLYYIVNKIDLLQEQIDLNSDLIPKLGRIETGYNQIIIDQQTSSCFEQLVCRRRKLARRQRSFIASCRKRPEKVCIDHRFTEIFCQERFLEGYNPTQGCRKGYDILILMFCARTNY